MNNIQSDLENSPKFLKKSDLEIKEEYQFKDKQIDINAGLLGKFFGNKENVPIYIAGILLVVFSISAIFFIPDNKHIWAMITLFSGYIFGKNK
jgi:hypothetical protein